MFLELEAIDRLLHERPLFTDAAINLFGQNLEALVADNRRLALSRLRKRWNNG